MADAGFEEQITDLATANGWAVSDLNSRRAIIRFDLPSGRTQTLYAIELGEVIELSVPSMLVFDTVDDVPRDLALACLRRSAKTKVGFWCLEQIEGKHTFSFMWNAPRKLLDKDAFGQIVRALVVGCDEFESEVVVDPDALDRELEDLLGEPSDDGFDELGPDDDDGPGTA
jgi:hypothetical protein